MKTVIKAVAWAIVVMGCALYGLCILATLIHPPAHQSDPIEDMQQIFSTEPVHLRFNLIMLGLIIIWGLAWGYTHEDKQ